MLTLILPDFNLVENVAKSLCAYVMLLVEASKNISYNLVL